MMLIWSTMTAGWGGLGSRFEALFSSGVPQFFADVHVRNFKFESKISKNE